MSSRLWFVCACLLVAASAASAGSTLMSKDEGVVSLQQIRSTIQRMKSEPEYATHSRAQILSELSHIAAKVGYPLTLDANGEPICFRDIQARAGIHPDLCLNASLPSPQKGRCYPACKEGFHGAEHLCRENCKTGYTYHSLWDECIEIGVVGPNTTGCPWYDSCGHLAAKGCSHCPPDHPHLDILLCECHLNHTQQKYKPVTYDRGHGEPAQCKAPRYMHNGLCFFNCTEQYKPFGSLCIEKCPNKYQEVGIICCDTLSDCIQRVGKIAEDALSMVEQIIAAATKGDIGAILEAIKDGIQIAMDLVVPDCIHI